MIQAIWGTYVQAGVVGHPAGALAEGDVLLLPLLAEALVALRVQNALPGWNVATRTHLLLIRALGSAAAAGLLVLLARREQV